MRAGGIRESGILRDPPRRREAASSRQPPPPGRCRRRRRRCRCPKCRRRRRGGADAGDLRCGNWRGRRDFGCGATTGVGSAFFAGAPAGLFAICGLGLGGGLSWADGGGGGGSADVDGRQPLDRLAHHADIEAGQDDRRPARHGPRRRRRSPWPGRAGRRFRGSSTRMLSLHRTTLVCARRLTRVASSAAEVGVLPLGTERRPDRDDDGRNRRKRQRGRSHNCRRAPRRSRPGSARSSRRSDCRADRRSRGTVPRASGGESSLRCTGTMPHAPCTATCIRNPPSAEQDRASLQKAQSGIIGSASRLAMMIARLPPELFRPDAEADAADDRADIHDDGQVPVVCVSK